ncbi:hypothetical protein Tco_1420406 [Tanacetum coccineum]
MFSIIYELMHRIIYKNSKKEKRVMRHSEIHKFCDATLIRVLVGLKSYNNDVKYGYVQRELTNDEVEYLKLFEEEIENSKKEKRVMRHSEIHKFCDATLIRVLAGLKSYNNDVKYGYVQRELTNDEVEYLKCVKKRVKYRNQMRRYEMYVNGRPLGPRTELPE